MQAYADFEVVMQHIIEISSNPVTTPGLTAFPRRLHAAINSQPPIPSALSNVPAFAP
jgi:hypothetical protein